MDSGKSNRRKNGTPVLDQGIAITGDLVVKLMGMKLLPIKVRLLVSSTDLARDLGLDWWREESERGPRARARDESGGKKRRAKRDKPDSSEITRRHSHPRDRNGSRHPS